MDAALRLEVENWIADDPDPETAGELSVLLEREDKSAFASTSMGFYSLVQLGYVDQSGLDPRV